MGRGMHLGRVTPPGTQTSLLEEIHTLAESVAVISVFMLMVVYVLFTADTIPGWRLRS